MMSKTMLFNIDENCFLEVYKTFDRTKEQVDDDLYTLTEWLKTQPHLPEIMNMASIRNFLIMNKFSIENTKKKIDCYYSIRSVFPDWFKSSNPNNLQRKEIMKDLLLVLHPKLYQNMYRVCFLKTTTGGKYLPHEACIQFFNVLELRLQKDCFVGDILISDMENYNFEDITRLTPAILAKFYKIYQKVYSLRIKAFYIINGPPAAAFLMSYIKPLVKPKIFQRTNMYKDAEILKDVFHIDDLPSDYGGNGPSLLELNDILANEFAEHNKRFEILETLKVDENMRPEELENDEHYGFYGNFKNLNID